MIQTEQPYALVLAVLCLFILHLKEPIGYPFHYLCVVSFNMDKEKTLLTNRAERSVDGDP